MSKQRKTATPPKPAKGNSDPKPQADTPHETQQAEIRRSVFGNLPSHFFLLNRRPELFGDSPFRPSVPALLAWQRREDLWQRELGRHAPMSVGEIVEIGRGLTVPVPAKIEDRVAQLTDTGNTLDYMDNMLIAAIKNDRQPVAEVAAEKAQADKPGLDAPAAAVVTQDETDFLPVSEVADVCGKSKGRISQLCTEGKIACRGKGPQRTVSLVSAQAHFAKTAKNRISKANATLARDARRDTRELERDRV